MKLDKATAMIGVDNRWLTPSLSFKDHKRDVLFFDGILLMHSTSAIHRWRQEEDNHECQIFAAEMEFLLESQYFFLPND
jgi:hypothetical protein